MDLRLEMNRRYHLGVGIVVAFIGTFICAILVALTTEMKMCQTDTYNEGISPLWWNYRRWNWSELFITLLGGLIGQAFQILIIHILWLLV